MDEHRNVTTATESLTTQTIDWYAEGQARTVVIGEQEVSIRFVGRKGRRGRIVISAPAGATFREE